MAGLADSDSALVLNSSNGTTATSVKSHFYPPSRDDDDVTAWIIVGIVVGVIISVFIIFVALRQLLIMFRNRGYESISSHKSPHKHSSNANDASATSVNTAEYSTHALDHNHNKYQIIGARKEQKGKQSKTIIAKKQSHSDTKQRDSSRRSKSTSTVNFVSSSSESEDENDQNENEFVSLLTEHAVGIQQPIHEQKQQTMEPISPRSQHSQNMNTETQRFRSRGTSATSATSATTVTSNATSIGFSTTKTHRKSSSDIV